MTQHTQGPWLTRNSGNRLDVYSFAAQKDIAFDIRNEANARLIAAAPDLLAALKALADIAAMYHKGEAPGHLDACECPDCCGHCLAMRGVNAAIAKADPNGEAV